MLTDNDRINLAPAIRADHPTNQALLDMATQIYRTLNTIKSGTQTYPAEDIAEVLTDRELLTLELWAGVDQTIADEVKRRRDEYEKFVNRFGERT
jgi:hypothetical protein